MSWVHLPVVHETGIHRRGNLHVSTEGPSESSLETTVPKGDFHPLPLLPLLFPVTFSEGISVTQSAVMT